MDVRPEMKPGQLKHIKKGVCALADEIAYQETANATKPDDWSLIPGSPMVEREN